MSPIHSVDRLGQGPSLHQAGPRWRRWPQFIGETTAARTAAFPNLETTAMATATAAAATAAAAARAATGSALIRGCVALALSRHNVNTTFNIAIFFFLGSLIPTSPESTTLPPASSFPVRPFFLSFFSYYSSAIRVDRIATRRRVKATQGAGCA